MGVQIVLSMAGVRHIMSRNLETKRACNPNYKLNSEMLGCIYLKALISS